MVREILQSKTAIVMRDTLINNKYLLTAVTAICLSLSTWGLLEVVASGKDITELKTEQKSNTESLNRHEEAIKSFSVIERTVIELQVRQELNDKNTDKKFEVLFKKMDDLSKQIEKKGTN